MRLIDKEQLVLKFCKENEGKITPLQCFEIPGIVQGVGKRQRAFASNLLVKMKLKGILMNTGRGIYQVNDLNKGVRYFNEVEDVIFF